MSSSTDFAAGTQRDAGGVVAWLRSARGGGLLALAVVLLALPLFLPNNFYSDVAI
jgi:hypothetical protein